MIDGYRSYLRERLSEEIDGEAAAHPGTLEAGFGGLRVAWYRLLVAAWGADR